MLTNPFKVTPRLAVVVGLAIVAVAVAGTFAVQRLASRAGTALQSGVVGNAAPSVDAVIPSDASGSGSVALPAAGFTLNEGATRNLYVRGTVSDPNGCADLNGVALTVYRPGVAYGGTDGMNAAGVLGQAGFTGSAFNYEGSVTAKGLNNAFASAVDPANRRLFVTDPNNSRVLEYDLNADGTPVDATADHVLGQADFTHGGYNRGTGTAAANTLYVPDGLIWDAANSRLFVADEYNSRIVVYDLSGGLVDGMDASHVLGQADFVHNGVNRDPAAGVGTVAANTLNRPGSLLLDGMGVHLYVGDVLNYRVLEYDLSSGIVDGMAASRVLGQADMSHGGINRDAGAGLGTVAAGTLYRPASLGWDASLSRLLIADYGNNRVLTYDGLTNGIDVDGQAASHVLGQADFTHGGINRDAGAGLGTVAANTLYKPRGFVWDAAASRLFIADYMNNRVLIFEMKNGLVNGMAATHELGQANFTSSGKNRDLGAGDGTAGANTLSWPTGIAWDAVHSRLFVPEFKNSRVLYFNLDAGSACTPDANDCYVATIAKAALAGCTGAGDNDATFEAVVPVANFADPTDAGSPYSFQSWKADVVVTDAATLAGTLSADFEVQSLAAFSVAPSLMDYGTIALGAVSAQQALTFTNTGNRGVNSYVHADGAMHSSLAGFADIASTQTRYSVSQAAAWAAGTAIAATDSDVPLALPQQQADAGPAPTAPAYFYLKLPATGIRGTYTNTLFFTAYAR